MPLRARTNTTSRRGRDFLTVGDAAPLMEAERELWKLFYEYFYETAKLFETFTCLKLAFGSSESGAFFL